MIYAIYYTGCIIKVIKNIIKMMNYIIMEGNIFKKSITVGTVLRGRKYFFTNTFTQKFHWQG